MNKFKVGDRVRLNPRTCTQRDLNARSSSGKFNKVYRVGGAYTHDCFLEGSNYHMNEFLIHDKQIYLGGE